MDRGRKECDECNKLVKPEYMNQCGTCSKNLCMKCMDKGCCGRAPAKTVIDLLILKALRKKNELGNL